MLAEVVGNVSYAGFWIGCGLIGLGYCLQYFGKGR